MRSFLKTAIILLSSIFGIAACGQKGPLFLPGNTNEISTSIPKQQASTDEDEDQDEIR